MVKIPIELDFQDMMKKVGQMAGAGGGAAAGYAGATMQGRGAMNLVAGPQGQRGEMIQKGLGQIAKQLPGAGMMESMAGAFKQGGIMGVATAGVGAILGFVKQIMESSKVFQGIAGSFFKIFGAMADVFLLPFLPLAMRGMQALLQHMPMFSKWGAATAKYVEEFIALWKAEGWKTAIGKALRDFWDWIHPHLQVIGKEVANKVKQAVNPLERERDYEVYTDAEGNRQVREKAQRADASEDLRRYVGANFARAGGGGDEGEQDVEEYLLRQQTAQSRQKWTKRGLNVLGTAVTFGAAPDIFSSGIGDQTIQQERQAGVVSGDLSKATPTSMHQSGEAQKIMASQRNEDGSPRFRDINEWIAAGAPGFKGYSNPRGSYFGGTFARKEQMGGMVGAAFSGASAAGNFANDFKTKNMGPTGVIEQWDRDVLQQALPQTWDAISSVYTAMSDEAKEERDNAKTFRDRQAEFIKGYFPGMEMGDMAVDTSAADDIAACMAGMKSCVEQGMNIMQNGIEANSIRIMEGTKSATMNLPLVDPRDIANAIGGVNYSLISLNSKILSNIGALGTATYDAAQQIQSADTSSIQTARDNIRNGIQSLAGSVQSAMQQIYNETKAAAEAVLNATQSWGAKGMGTDYKTAFELVMQGAQYGSDQVQSYATAAPEMLVRKEQISADEKHQEYLLKRLRAEPQFKGIQDMMRRLETLESHTSTLESQRDTLRANSQSVIAGMNDYAYSDPEADRYLISRRKQQYWTSMVMPAQDAYQRHIETMSQRRQDIANLQHWISTKKVPDIYYNSLGERHIENELYSWMRPSFDAGGIVPGDIGESQLIMAQGGEQISPIGMSKGGGGSNTSNKTMYININTKSSVGDILRDLNDLDNMEDASFFNSVM